DLRRHLAGELGGVAVNTLRMLGRTGVLRLERGRQGRHRLVIRVLEEPSVLPLELEQMPQVPRIEEQLLVRQALLTRAERRSVEASGEALDDGEELQRAEGLEHERVRADLACNSLVGEVRTGQQHDRNVASRLRAL